MERWIPGARLIRVDLWTLAVRSTRVALWILGGRSIPGESLIPVVPSTLAIQPVTCMACLEDMPSALSGE